jgi:hypothetical protein
MRGMIVIVESEEEPRNENEYLDLIAISEHRFIALYCIHDGRAGILYAHRRLSNTEKCQEEMGAGQER